MVGVMFFFVIQLSICCAQSPPQGFRGKNRDLMRQDIVDVLKTSRMDLVRAMIGLSPYAVHRWHTAYLKVVAGIAFRYVVSQARPLPCYPEHLRLGANAQLANKSLNFDRSLFPILIKEFKVWTTCLREVNNLCMLGIQISVLRPAYNFFCMYSFEMAAQ